MITWIRGHVRNTYERLLRREISETPDHVAVIQDGNRRYADKEGQHKTAGHREGAATTENLLRWCDELDVREVTLYAFSTENFNRPDDEQEALFDLIEEKLYDFADRDRVHDAGVCIRAIGETHRLPRRVRDAIDYAERQTAEYDQLNLNIALAYGGRAELLTAARDVAKEVDAGRLDPDDIDVATVESKLYDGPVRDVDLIIRTGGDERTSNFLPWYAKGNEAAAYFCTPYWPEFRKIDFLRSIRTYESREASWQRTKARRALALVRAFGGTELDEARGIYRRFRDRLPSSERPGSDVVPSEGVPDEDPNREPLAD
jgi:tritrans,polycis-undecaprenyl-diphosphate synthase [geranylgeranyl-diphosphate specific]